MDEEDEESPPLFDLNLDIDPDIFNKLFETYIGSADAGVTIIIIGLVVGALFFCCTNPRPIAFPKTVSLKSQADVVQGTEECYESKLVNSGLVESAPNDFKTLSDLLFVRGVTPLTRNGDAFVFGARKSLGFKNFDWLKYNEAIDKILVMSSGLVYLGLTPKEKNFVGIIGKNSLEYALLEHSIYYVGCVMVPVHDYYGYENMSYIITQTAMAAIAIQDEKRANFVLEFASRGLRFIVLFNPPSSQFAKAAEKKGITIVCIDEVLDLGEKFMNEFTRPPREVQETDPAVCLFSATTEKLRGITLSHQNVVSAVMGIKNQLHKYAFKPDDTYFAYIPRRHASELVFQMSILMQGGRIGFFQGDNKELIEDMKALKPTIVLTIPRVVNRVYDLLQTRMADSCCQRLIYKWGLGVKLKYLSRGCVLSETLWDRLIFRRIRARFGNRVRLVVITSAPVNPDVLTFTRSVLGCSVLVLYGTAETCGVATMTFPGDHMVQHVGPPVPCCQVKVKPNDEYSSIFLESGRQGDGGPVGEVCVKGENVCSTYIIHHESSEDSTPKLSKTQGFVCTGDIGRWLKNGTLQLLGRKNENMKAAQGEWFNPGRVEEIIERNCKFVKQAYIHGERLQPWTVALIYPNFNLLKKVPSCAGKPVEEMCEDPTANESVFEDVSYVGRCNGFKVHELPRAIKLIPTKFSKKDGTMVGNVKNRLAIDDVYENEIKKMYQDTGAVEPIDILRYQK